MGNKLENIPLNYLRLIGDLFELNDPKTVKKLVNAEIERRTRVQYENLTLKVMCECGIITVKEGAFLYTNKINNFRDLMECNLDELIGITPSLKDKLERVRRFYDVSKFVEADEKIQITDGYTKK